LAPRRGFEPRTYWL